MKINLIPVFAVTCGAFLSVSAMADTLSGKLVYKGADDNLIMKSGTVELDPENISKVKLALEGQTAEVARRVKFRKFETEDRTVVVAAFRKVRNLPENTSLIIKANVLSGTNGKLVYGDVFTRSCEKGFAEELTDQESALERIMIGMRERRGCDLKYRGGILFSTVQAED